MGLTPAAVLYDASGKALAVQDETTIPADTPGLLILGEGTDGKAYRPRVSPEGRWAVEQYPPIAPPGTTPFVLAADDPLEVGPNPIYHETVGPLIASGQDVHVQFLAGGAAGDPSETGSKVEIYWRIGAPAVDHLVERIYLSGSTVAVILPDANKARDGTTMTGNGSNSRLVIRRERLSVSAQEIDAVVRGYTEAT